MLSLVINIFEFSVTYVKKKYKDAHLFMQSMWG